MGLSITLHSIQAIAKTGELSSEVYVLIAVATFKTRGLIPALPNLQVFTSELFEHLKEKNPDPTIANGAPFWGLDGTPQKIKNPESVAIVVSVMEHDHGVLAQYSLIVKVGGLLSLVTSLGDKDATSRATRLTRDIKTTLGAVKVPIPFVLDDDLVGTQQLTLSKSDLKSKEQVERTLVVGPYELVFHITPKK